MACFEMFLRSFLFGVALTIISSDAWAYQTLRVRSEAYFAIACRYADTDRCVTARMALFPNPLSRPASTKLAARRLRSYSHGPGRVSSKSLTSNSWRRSGEAKVPKFARCASPQSCAVRPEVGVDARSLAMTLAAPR